MITQFKIYESDTDFKIGDKVMNIMTETPFKILDDFGVNFRVLDLRNGVKNNWNKDHFVSMEYWEFYKSTQKYNL